MNTERKLWLTSMSGPGQVENIVEIIEPILDYIDGVIWVLNDCPVDDPGARYLETVKKGGKIIHRSFIPRHQQMMNETLYCGAMQEGDFCLWIDPLERVQLPFIQKVKSELIPFMDEAGVDVIYAWGKPYLFRYLETLEYRNSPHWSLAGYGGRAVEWSNIEKDENLVRKNMRPVKRTDKYHFISHYLRYFIAFPAGSNSALLGLDHFPGGMTQENFNKREAQRLEFRKEMKARGFPLTVDGFKSMVSGDLDEVLKDFLRSEKVLSDAYYYLINGRTDVKDSHNPADAIPIP
jgi:hypothetical protein